MRSPGGFWVRMGKVWEVSFWDGNHWERAGDDDQYVFDADFDEIDPREIVRN